MTGGPVAVGPRRGERSVAFLDLCGYAGYTRAAGDDAATAVVLHLRGVVRESAVAFGVERVHWTGDGAMLVARDRDRLLACVDRCLERLCTESPLALRAGVATGPCIVLPDGDVLGDTVNRAERACREARAARIAVDGTTEALRDVA